MDWIRGLAAVWAPVLLGLVVALVSRAFLTAAGLRKDLNADAQLLAALPPGGTAYAHLRISIQKRVLRLVTLAQYPSFSTTDLLGVLGTFVVGALSVFVGIGVLDGQSAGHGAQRYFVLSLPALLAAAAVVFWHTFFGGWSRRAAARFMFLDQHLGREEVGELALLFRTFATTLAIATPLVVVGPHIFLLCCLLDRAFGWPTPLLLLVVGSTGAAAYGGYARYYVRSAIHTAVPLSANDERRAERVARYLMARAEAKEDKVARVRGQQRPTKARHPLGDESKK